jgi:hypothetical protein
MRPVGSRQRREFRPEAGRGIDRAGLGLVIMREQAEAVGASFPRADLDAG